MYFCFQETPPQDKSNENDDKKDRDQTVMTVDTRRVSIPGNVHTLVTFMIINIFISVILLLVYC